MNTQRNNFFFILLFSIFFLSACSSVGDIVSKTGDIVSQTGKIIGGEKKEEGAKLPELKAPELPKEIKIKVAKPASAKILLKSTDRLGQSRINVTVVQLKSSGKFKSSRLSDLVADTEAALGSDFISKQNISLKKGESKPLNFEIDPDAKVIGAFASFRELNQTIWRTQVDLPQATDTAYTVLISIDNKSISATKF